MKKCFVLFALSATLGCTFQVRADLPEPRSQTELDARGENADWNRLGHAFDNEASRLFWHTDLEKAKEVAAHEGKPILSLRLLGKLSDEYSCANSRFFRVALYPDTRVNPLLREKFVLHWWSERPVPIVTIDMGDGRKLKRTLTGNSAHYLLDETGRPLDVLPGLYAPGAFARWLQEGANLSREFAAKPETEKTKFLSTHHRATLEKTIAFYAERDEKQAVPSYLPRLALRVNEYIQHNPLLAQQIGISPSMAMAAQETTFRSKISVEAPMLRAISLLSLEPRRSASDFTTWEFLGRKHTADAELGAASRALLSAKMPSGELVFSPPAPSPQSDVRYLRVGQTVGFGDISPVQTQAQIKRPKTPAQRFEAALAPETAFNELRMHAPIRALFIAEKVGEFEALNRLIYDRLFLTPKADAWLGLRDDAAFTALTNGGVEN